MRRSAPDALDLDGSELLISLRVSRESSDGHLVLTCAGPTGTTLAGLEVPAPEEELLSALAGRASERLEAVLVHAGGRTQQIRLAYPDGSPIEEVDWTVSTLLASDRWRTAEVTAPDAMRASGASSPTRGSYSQSPAFKRSSSSSINGGNARKSARELEVRLGKLQDAKKSPLVGSVERRGLEEAMASSPSKGSQSSDWAAHLHGGKVLMTTSLDEQHPPDNIIDGDDLTYWISTGLYPQEILLELGHPANVSDVWLSTTNVRRVCIEGCGEETAISFQTLAAAELTASEPSRLQLQQLRCEGQNMPTRFVKAKILSGWDDFCTVHRIVVQ